MKNDFIGLFIERGDGKKVEKQTSRAVSIEGFPR